MVSVCSVRNKKASGLSLLILSGPIKRPHIPLYRLIHSGSVLHEELHQLDISAACCNVHCRCAARNEIGVGAKEDEESPLSVVPSPKRLQHRVTAAFARLQPKRAACDEEPDDHSADCGGGMFKKDL
ncbi:MAG: hypothetical protein QOI07_203 [Verrucomicrobiota bacterium]